MFLQNFGNSTELVFLFLMGFCFLNLLPTLHLWNSLAASPFKLQPRLILLSFQVQMRLSRTAICQDIFNDESCILYPKPSAFESIQTCSSNTALKSASFLYGCLKRVLKACFYLENQRQKTCLLKPNVISHIL